MAREQRRSGFQPDLLKLGRMVATLGSTAWTGTGSLGGKDHETVGSVGVMPEFSAGAPGINIFAASTNNQLLNAETTEIEKVQGGFRVTVCATDGLSSFTVANVIDTTPEGWRDSGRSAVRAKALTATLQGKLPDNKAELRTEQAVIRKGVFPDEWLLRVELPATADWLLSERDKSNLAPMLKNIILG